MSDKSRKLVLYCDGASRGNPGPSSYGIVILENGAPVYEAGERIPDGTNNVAEYEGLIQGLTHCARLEGSEVIVRSDSQLLVRQMLGQYKVKTPHILTLFNKAKVLASRFSVVHFEHIPREQNKSADKLANAALDRALK
jgi:ribonuclease HI